MLNGPDESKGSADLQPSPVAPDSTAKRDPKQVLQRVHDRRECFKNRGDSTAKRFIIALGRKNFDSPLYQAILADDLAAFQKICQSEGLDPHHCINDILALGAQSIGTWALEQKGVDVRELKPERQYDILALLVALEHQEWLLAMCEHMGLLNIDEDEEVQPFPEGANVDRYALYTAEEVLQEAVDERAEHKSGPCT